MTNKIFYLTFFLLPLYLLKLPLFELGSTNFLDILLLLSIVIGVLKLKKPYPPNKLKKLFFQNKFFFLCVFFVLFSFSISFLLNANEASWLRGLGILKSFLILPLFFGIITTILLKNKLLSLEGILWSLFVSIGLQGIIGYFLVIKGVLTFDGRLVFIYDSPNYFAILLAVGILLGAALLKKPSALKRISSKYHALVKTLIILFIIADVFALVMTQSLGAWIGLVFAMSILFAFQYSTTTVKTISIFLFLLVLFFFFIFFFLNFLLGFVAYTPSVPPTSFDSRIAIYLSAKEILLDNLLVGIGSGNFQNNYLTYQKLFLPYPQWAVPHAHNTFLHFWVEGGILAALSFFLLEIKLLVFTKIKTASTVAVSFAILVYFLTHGLIDTPLWKNDLAVIFWFFASCLAIMIPSPAKD